MRDPLDLYTDQALGTLARVLFRPRSECCFAALKDAGEDLFQCQACGKLYDACLRSA